MSKSSDHIDSSDLCQACHTILGFAIIPYVDHQQVSGACNNCLNGVTAFGKSDQHEPTTGECDECHTTASFLPIEPDGSHDHTGISSGCIRCHDSILAIGANSNNFDHATTASDCIVCHTTDAFKPAFVTDHDSITEACNTCHNGSVTTGQTAGHTDNSHTITYPANNAVDGQDYAGFCASCHWGDFRRQVDHIGGENGTLEQNKDCTNGNCHRVNHRDWGQAD